MQASGKMRKVTVRLPDDLIQRAMTASGTDLASTGPSSLEKVIAAQAFADARALQGTMKLSIDVDELRRDRD